jgi:hypothetical protein
MEEGSEMRRVKGSGVVEMTAVRRDEGQGL